MKHDDQPPHPLADPQQAAWERRLKLAFGLGPLAVVITLLARYVPWIFSYVLGPAILLACAAFFLTFRPFFFFFRSDGSPAGMLAPLILWPALLLGVWLGWLVIKAGRQLLRDRQG
jgi:hypothetical protein